MFQDFIKGIFKFFGGILGFALILALIAFFVFGIDAKWNLTKKFSSQFASTNTATFITPQANSTSNERFQEGKHYKKFAAKVTTNPTVQQFVASDPGKIQVIEFFNYACFWCQRLHPKINEWAATKPPEVVLYRFPIVFNKAWEVMAKAYIMVQMLGKTDALDDKFFQAIHKDNIDLANEKLLQEFFEKQGVPKQQFLEMYNSFAVNRAFTHSKELADAYELTISPAIVVNGPTGSYLITTSMAGSDASILEILSFVIEKEKGAS